MYLRREMNKYFHGFLMATFTALSLIAEPGSVFG